jgi:hypothetical protein
VARPNVDRRLRDLGYEPTSIALAGTATHLKNAIETWGRMITATGMTAE